MNTDKIKILYENSIKKSKIPNEIGMSRSTFFEMMNGIGSPRVENLEKVAKYFNKPISYFFDEEIIPNQDQENKIKELEEELHALRKKVEEYEKEIKLKDEILNTKNELLKQKDETIELLKKQIDSNEPKIPKKEIKKDFAEGQPSK